MRADRYSLKYMESDPVAYPQSALHLIVRGSRLLRCWGLRRGVVGVGYLPSLATAVQPALPLFA